MKIPNISEGERKRTISGSISSINQSINLRLKEEDRIIKTMSRRHYSKSTMEETK